MKHTKEPWQIGICEHTDTWFLFSGVDGYGEICVGFNLEANARRIVACVNACRGLPTDELGQHGIVVAVGSVIQKLEQQRDDTIAAIEHYLNFPSWDNEEMLRKIVAKAKGE